MHMSFFFKKSISMNIKINLFRIKNKEKKKKKDQFKISVNFFGRGPIPYRLPRHFKWAFSFNIFVSNNGSESLNL